MNILDQAADRLRGRWIQGRMRDNDGGVCLIGALLDVGVGAGGEAFRTVYSLLPLDAAGSRNEIAFNDDPNTTEEDVLLLLKRASVLYDERHPS